MDADDIKRVEQLIHIIRMFEEGLLVQIAFFEKLFATLSKKVCPSENLWSNVCISVAGVHARVVQLGLRCPLFVYRFCVLFVCECLFLDGFAYS